MGSSENMVLRSVLFVPGSSMKMIGKASALAADAIILDLEDAVPLADKVGARKIVKDCIPILKSLPTYLFVRVNGLTTKLTPEDLKCVTAGLSGVMLAKSESQVDIMELDSMIAEAEEAAGLEDGSVKIIPLIESARGVVNSHEIASGSERIVAVAFGAGDYYRDLGRNVASISAQQTELLYARSQIVNCGRAAGVQAIDTPFFGVLTDQIAFAAEATLALQLGFKGKLLVHPSQIESANRLFAPSAEEVEYYRRLVAVFQEAEARGLGAVSFEGKMIDYMNFKQAQSVVDFGDIIARKESRQKEPASSSISQFFAPYLAGK